MFRSHIRNRSQSAERSIRLNGKRTAKRQGWLLPAAALLATLLSSASSLADEVNIDLTAVIPHEIAVLSNGSEYAGIAGSGLGNIVGTASVELDAETAGRVKSWSVWLVLHNGAERLSLSQYAVGKSYPLGDRPKRVDRTEQIVVPQVAYDQWIVDQCNALAQSLRNAGQGNKAIFSKDRSIKIAVEGGADYDLTGAGSNNIIIEGAPWQVFIDVNCKKWGGVTAPVAGGGVTTGLVSAQLTVIETYGPSGVCMLKLSGVLESGSANTKVRYRYEDDQGHKSSVYDATTDHSKTAYFYQEYSLANNPDGPETGKVRVVGVNYNFVSAWKPYSLNCVKPGATGLTATLPPTLTLAAVAIPGNAVMIGGQICPKQVRLAGKILGNGHFHGNAVFFGPSYLSPQQPYEVENDSAAWVFAIYDLNWAHDINQLAVPDTDDEPMQQTVPFSFNVNGSETPGALIPMNDPPVASIQQKPFKFTCQWPKVTPGLQGSTDMTVPQPKPAAQQQTGQALAGSPQVATVTSPFSILSPRGVAQQGVIRLQGVTDKKAKFALSWSANKNGAYKAVHVRGLPEAMTGATTKFDIKALAAAPSWRLQVCPQGGTSASACRQADFKAPALQN
ncbi:MAG TPA: hypothetical protein VMT98_16105 [Verrucomicrobiae bacterium]|nr:hypothetical protein [Verrucomicrobiae bacterium]